MIKKIPIKGISRSPSGEVSSEGTCAESINVQMDMGEVAPVVKPQPVKGPDGEDISVDGDILFLHKGGNYENLIFRTGNDLRYIRILPKEGAFPASGTVMSGLADGETINDIDSIGNTIIVSTSEDMYYILWRNSHYEFLGNKIPVPSIFFRMGDMRALRTEPNIPDEAVESTDPIAGNYKKVEFQRSDDEGGHPTFAHENTGDITEFGSRATKYVFDPLEKDGFWCEYMDAIWGAIDSMLSENRENGKAIFPVFARYAIRLYDGSLYAQSIPVLIGADLSKYVDVKGAIQQFSRAASEGAEEDVLWTFTLSIVGLPEGYSLFLNADGQTNLFEGWEDIVSSVDIFISPQMIPIQRRAAKFNVIFQESGEAIDIARGYKLDNFFIDPYYTVLHQEEIVLSNQGTYLVKSFQLDEFAALSGDTKLDIDFSSDDILSRSAMAETPWSMHHNKGERLFNYNRRLLLSDVEQHLYTGYPFLHSSAWADGSGSKTPLRFVYYLRGENGEAIVISRDEDGDTFITPKSKAVVSESSTLYNEIPMAWIAYPDARCYRVDIYFNRTNTRVTSYQMKALSQADVAYAFFGFGQSPDVGDITSYNPTEKAVLNMPNTILASKANNPFIFPVEDVISFNASEIINTAVATVPLSEGQFGQFPLYVFTDEGVFAVSVNSSGKFVTNHPVSRDVLLSRDALVAIEQGVFFASARGVLLLQGSKVTKVSSQMEGVTTPLDAALLNKISKKLLNGLSVEDPEPFHQFLKDCKMAYDFANTRILLFKDGSNIMLAYKFDTQTWHRLSPDAGNPIRPINSYPEALVVVEDDGKQKPVNMSVIEESEDAEVLPGIIYTKDLALDHSDIYKTVHRLRIRGRYVDGHVKWQLLGSNDGINYRPLHSVHGPSWKWFRVVIVTHLDPGERLSYIEIEYEPRFTDRIR